MDDQKTASGARICASQGPSGADTAPASCEARREQGRAETERRRRNPPPKHILVPPRATWRLEEAKARFSEVVRRAHDQGPQYVTVRGKQAVAIIDAAELERLLPPGPEALPLVQFLESLHIEGLDLTRDRDLGREPAL